jgi:hypothetical protein
LNLGIWLDFEISTRRFRKKFDMRIFPKIF